MEKFILYAIIGVAIALAMSYLNKAAQKKVKSTKGIYELRLNKMYLYSGIGCVLLGVLAFVIMIINLEGNDIGYGVFFLILFGGLGTICILWYKNHKVKFDDESIESTDVFGKTNSIAWENIVDIKANFMSGMLIIKDTEGNKIKAHLHLIGLGDLVKFIERKTKWTAKELKIPIGHHNPFIK